MNKIVLHVLLSSCFGAYLLASQEAPSRAWQNNINAVVSQYSNNNTTQMLTSDEWILWVKKMIADKVPTEQMLAKITAALINCPNPRKEMSAYIDLYYTQVPAELRIEEEVGSLFLNNPVWHELKLLELDFPLALPLETKKKKRQELLKEFSPYAENWRPYAVADKLLYLLVQPLQASCMNIAPTPQTSEGLLLEKVNPQLMREYLHYVRAAHGVLPKIYGRLHEKSNWDDKFDALNYAHVYGTIGTEFRFLPVSSETFALEDDLIKLFQEHLKTIELAIHQKSNAYENVLEKDMLDPLLADAEKYYHWFLESRKNAIKNAIEKTQSSQDIDELISRLANLEKLSPQNNNNTSSCIGGAFDDFRCSLNLWS